MGDSDRKDDEYWREQLTPEEFSICREKGTERPFTGKYNSEFRDGTYFCTCCGEPLFSSKSKFDAGCGWPSFSAPRGENNITETPDHSHGMIRTEITCSHCGSHLGHVFEDGPAPTGLRYCVNSLSLKFEPGEEG